MTRLSWKLIPMCMFYEGIQSRNIESKVFLEINKYKNVKFYDIIIKYLEL